MYDSTIARGFFISQVVHIFTLAYLTGMLLSGCSRSDNPSAPEIGTPMDAAESASSNNSLALGEPARFFLCLNPPMVLRDEDAREDFVGMRTPHLRNMEFLAYAAELLYEPTGSIALEFEDLGFGQEGDGDWLRDCAADIQLLKRKKLITRDIFGVHGLTECAETYKSQASAPSIEKLERWVFGRVDPTRSLQILSAGHLELDESSKGGDFVWAEHRDASVAVVIFKGSTWLDDLLTDLRLRKRNFAVGVISEYWGRVHEGFLSAYRQIRPALEARLELLPDDTRLLIAGHSLGGAMAMIAAADILEHHPFQVLSMTSFGAPKVGDEDFAAKLAEATYQNMSALHRIRTDSMSILVSGKDPISFLPMDIPFTVPYEPAGATLSLYRDGRMNFLTSSGSSNQAPSSFYQRFVGWLRDVRGDFWGSVSRSTPHIMHNYRERIEEAIRRSDNSRLLDCDKMR